MKQMRLIGFLLSFMALAACTKPLETKAPELVPDPIKGREGLTQTGLAAIDSLMWQRPDSALALLLPCFDSCRDAMLASPTDDAGTALETHSMRLYNRHYAHLLLAELLYKNDSAQTNRVELRQAVAYYDSLLRVADTRGVSLHRPVRRDASNASVADTQTIAFLDARAHYINGVGYYESDSIVEACREYLKALEIMEEHFGEKELVGEKARFMALTYTHLTGLFSDQYLHEQTIYFGNKALDYYRRFNATPWHIAWMYNEIGSNYHILCDFNKADSLYDLAINVLPDTNNLIYRDIVVLKAFLQYKKVKQAKMSLQQLKSLLLLSESEKEYLARCAIIGEIYFRERQFDSALVYLNQVFQESQNEELKKQTAEFLVDILKKQGQDLEIFEYAEFLVPFANLSENESYLKSQLTELCNGYKQKRTENLHQKKLMKTNKNTNLTIGLLLGVVALMAVSYGLIRKRHRKLEVRQNETVKLLESERYAHEIQQKALAGRLRKSNDLLRLQSEMAIKIQESMEKEKLCAPHGDYEALIQETPCHEIIESLEGTNIKRISVPNDYAELSLSPQQLLSLAKVTEKHFCGFESYLRNLYPKISALDIDICRLFLLGLNEKQASILLHRDYSTIMEHVRKMKKALRIEKNLRDFIRNGG